MSCAAAPASGARRRLVYKGPRAGALASQSAAGSKSADWNNYSITGHRGTFDLAHSKALPTTPDTYFYCVFSLFIFILFDYFCLHVVLFNCGGFSLPRTSKQLPAIPTERKSLAAIDELLDILDGLEKKRQN